jgi:hypothetical protein
MLASRVEAPEDLLGADAALTPGGLEAFPADEDDPRGRLLDTIAGPDFETCEATGPQRDET